ncbi:hypothetical protein OAF27_01520 [Verrucomicrobiales bacterium]|nr:hypothetical protein [Verrucomicrobiales bacterium]
MTWKRRKLAIVGGSSAFAFLGFIIWAVVTETQNGQASNLNELRSSMSKLKSLQHYSDSSVLLDFPYVYPVEWTRMQVRPNFHWHGKARSPEINEFFERSEIRPSVRKNENGEPVKATFILEELGCQTQAKVNLETGEFSFTSIYMQQRD